MNRRGDTADGHWWRYVDGAAEPIDNAEDPPPPEFPSGAVPETPNRRQALQFLTAAALALPAAACDRAPEHIVPYVELPEGLTPGKPLHFATSLQLAGIAQPVVAESHEGRPTKIEGNPQHPASRGRTDAFAQAAILSLYDPARSRTLLKNGQITSWPDFLAAVSRASQSWKQTGGAGLRLLSGRTTSPTLARQITALRRQYPNLVWHRWEPINDDNVLRGAELAFGRRLEPHYRLGEAEVIVALDADLLGPGPRQVTHAIAFSDGRRARASSRTLTRLYVAEPLLTLTGAMADSRHPARRTAVGDLAQNLASHFGAGQSLPITDQSAARWLEMVARDIEAHHGRALVAVGRTQPPHVHALAAWINHRIGAAGTLVSWHEPIELDPVEHGASIAALARDLAAGHVEALVILGGNPAYDAPADLGFSEALQKVPLSVHLGLHANETAALTHWHVPELHPLESWSDARAADGTFGIMQPLITPLYDGRSAHELVAVLAGDLNPSAHDIVREHWQLKSGVDPFESFWRQTLQDGFTTRRPEEPGPPGGEPRLPLAPALAPPPGFEVVFAPDESVWDGCFAENAWLQELPDPLTKEVWGNAATLAPSDATALSIRDGDIVRIEVGERRLEMPVVITPGQAAGTIGLKLGYGRKTGVIAKGIGTDTYPLRTSDALWAAAGATLAKTGGHVSLARTQISRSMQGRDIVRTMSLAELATAPAKQEPEPPATSLYPTFPPARYAWAMVIDQSVCIGCNACVTACQAENNIPVVGPEEVRSGRDMQWLRVDLYFKGPPDDPDTLFQPVPCMHCEKAPCEPVCPVEASVHDSEGLNVQVYNRCVGTRFCQANCPYKVRHFNFYGYADGQEYKNLGEPIIEAAHNPDVTVRARGVMEKCTYCVQRISAARRLAERENRPIRDGEVVPACAQACPTRAIIFGNLQDHQGEVARLRREPHEYALLGHLGTRPRTTYLARVRAMDREDRQA